MTAHEVLLPATRSENVAGLVIAGVLFATLLWMTIKRPKPSTWELYFRRTLLALLAGLIANYILGTIIVNLSPGIRATGSLAITVIVYFLNPGAVGPAGPLTLLLMLAIAGNAAAATQDDLQRGCSDGKLIAIFDLVTDVADVKVESEVFAFPRKGPLGESFCIGIESEMKPARIMKQLKTTEGDRRTDRWISHRGDRLFIYVHRRPGQRYTLKIEELPRDTQFAGDVARLIKAIGIPKAAAFTSDSTEFDVREYALDEERASLKLTVVAELPAEVRKDSAGDPNDPRPPQPLSVSIATGPTEHLYLSTGLPVTSLDDLELDEATNTLVPKERPKKFLIGVNWQLGDILSKNDQSIESGLSLGVHLEASEHPTEHMAIAFGYRFPADVLGGAGLQAFSPFFGYQRTTKESLGASGEVDSKGVWKGVFGINLNLDRAIEWLK